MKTFKIVYRWSEREYTTTMPGPTAAHALMFAEFQIMPGARVIGVEVPR
jgi:hypothetical protein